MRLPIITSQSDFQISWTKVSSKRRCATSCAARGSQARSRYSATMLIGDPLECDSAQQVASQVAISPSVCTHGSSTATGTSNPTMTCFVLSHLVDRKNGSQKSTMGPPQATHAASCTARGSQTRSRYSATLLLGDPPSKATIAQQAAPHEISE